GRYGLVVQPRNGETWISQEFTCEGRNFYRVGCWARTTNRRATIRLQSVATWQDFAVARHSGSGQWEYLFAVGAINNEGPMYPARVKIQVGRGVVALFDNVTV